MNMPPSSWFRRFAHAVLARHEKPIHTYEYDRRSPPVLEALENRLFLTVLINEIDADQASTDSAEFVELYDGGVGQTALDGLAVVFYNGNRDVSYRAFDLDGQSTDANGFFVLCGDSANVLSCDLEVSPNTNLLQNGADAVAVYSGDGSDFPNGTTVIATNLIDAIVYDSNDADDIGLISVLTPGQAQINENGAGNKDNHSNSRVPDGGTALNSSTYVQQVPTPGASNVIAPPSGVLINEVDADQAGTDTAEFVELYDGGVGQTALDGLVVVLYNGNGDVSYNAFDLGGQSTDSNGFFVLCGDFANVPNCDLDVSPNTNLLQNGPDAVAVYSGDVSNFSDGTPVTATNLLDAVVYDTDDADDTGLISILTPGQAQINENGSGNKDNHSNSRVPDGGTALDTSTYVQQESTPRTSNVVAPPTTATLIHDIQGVGNTSPLLGNRVLVEGIVVGEFQNPDTQLGGFFVQEEDADADADVSTSEGVFVFDQGFGVAVNEGDLVEVTGDVSELFQLTRLTNVTSVNIISNAHALPTTASVSLPVAELSDWEQYEGMLVHIDQTLVATGQRNLGRFGEVEVSVDERLDEPTNVTTPGTAAVALQDLNDRSRIIVDDGSTVTNPLPSPYVGLNGTLRLADTLDNLTGVLGFAFGDYRIHPTASVDFTRVNARQTTPPSVGGSLKVASFNLLNYFTTIDTGANICGPAGDSACRGADSASELARQRDKIISAMVAMDAEIIGVMEIENNGNTAIADLVDGLNAVAGAGVYGYIDTGIVGPDVIRNAIIHKTAIVKPAGAFAVLDSNVHPLFIDTLNRPTIAQTFEDIARGEKFTVAVNHLKSKGSACDAVGDPDRGDGQGDCNLIRTNAAIAVTNWLATDPTGSEDSDFLIIGDLNAYAMEDPITAIKNGGYTDLVDAANEDGHYSFVNSGQAGYLDHALASTSMLSKVAGAAFWHINADEPGALDYQDTNPPGLYSPDAFRSSDHDPLIIGIGLVQVAEVLVSAVEVPGQTLTSSWDVSFLAAADPVPGRNVGFRISAGASQQLEPLPWVNINAIHLVFTGEVSPKLGDLQMLGDIHGTYSFNSVSYDGANQIASWIMDHPFGVNTSGGLIGGDSLLLALSSSVTGIGPALDGEIADPANASLPSGNGEPGGDFRIRINTLPGDTNRNNRVNVLDTLGVRNRSIQEIGDPNYSVFYDLNGSGNINVIDTLHARNRGFTSLPAMSRRMPAAWPNAAKKLTMSGTARLGAMPSVSKYLSDVSPVLGFSVGLVRGSLVFSHTASKLATHGGFASMTRIGKGGIDHPLPWPAGIFNAEKDGAL